MTGHESVEAAVQLRPCKSRLAEEGVLDGLHRITGHQYHFPEAVCWWRLVRGFQKTNGCTDGEVKTKALETRRGFGSARPTRPPPLSVPMRECGIQHRLAQK